MLAFQQPDLNIIHIFWDILHKSFNLIVAPDSVALWIIHKCENITAIYAAIVKIFKLEPKWWTVLAIPVAILLVVQKPKQNKTYITPVVP